MPAPAPPSHSMLGTCANYLQKPRRRLPNRLVTDRGCPTHHHAGTSGHRLPSHTEPSLFAPAGASQRKGFRHDQQMAHAPRACEDVSGGTSQSNQLRGTPQLTPELDRHHCGVFQGSRCSGRVGLLFQQRPSGAPVTFVTDCTCHRRGRGLAAVAPRSLGGRCEMRSAVLQGCASELQSWARDEERRQRRSAPTGALNVISNRRKGSA